MERELKTDYFYPVSHTIRACIYINATKSIFNPFILYIRREAPRILLFIPPYASVTFQKMYTQIYITLRYIRKNDEISNTVI